MANPAKRVAVLLAVAFCQLAAAEGSVKEEDSVIIFALYIPVVVVFLMATCRAQYLTAHASEAAPTEAPVTIAASVGRPAAASFLLATALPELRSTVKGREVNNLWHLHTWIRLALRNDHSLRFYSHLSDTHMVLYSFLHVVSAMLVTTILYATTEPNDDYCYERSLESECLEDHTVFTRLNHRCHWSDSGGCSFRHMKDSVVDIVFAALVVCFCCSLVMVFCEHAVRGLCATVVKLPKEYRLKSVRTRGNFWGLLDVAYYSCGSHTLHSDSVVFEEAQTDFNLLNQAISLRKNALPNGAIRNQFCTAWGISTMTTADKLPLPQPDLQNSGRDDLAVEQLYANSIFLDLLYAHQKSIVAIREISSLKAVLAQIPEQQAYLESYYDIRVIQELLYDLLPDNEAVVVKASIGRQVQPPDVVSSRFVQPVLVTLVLAYLCGVTGYVLLFAATSMHPLQLVWLLTVVVWFFIDSIVLQPLMLVLQGHLVPLLTKDLLYRAQKVMLKNILCLDLAECSHLYDEQADEMPELPPLGDCLDSDRSLGLYFFASAGMTSHFGSIPSRAIDFVSKFSSSYPRFVESYIDPDDEAFVDRLVRSWRDSMVALLAFFEGLPLRLSTFVLQVVLLGLIWILLILHIELYESRLSIGVWVPSIVFFVAVFLFSCYILFMALQCRVAKNTPQEGEDTNCDVVKISSRDCLHAGAVSSVSESRPTELVSPARAANSTKVPDENEICDFNYDKSYSILPSESASVVSLEYSELADVIDHLLEAENDNISYTVDMSVSNRSSSSSLSVELIDQQEVTTNRRKPSVSGVSKREKDCTNISIDTFSFPTRNYKAAPGANRTDLLLGVTIDETKLAPDSSNVTATGQVVPQHDDDDDRSYSIVTSKSQATSVTIDYEDCQSSSYTVDVSVSNSSSRSSVSVDVKPAEDSDEAPEFRAKPLVAFSDSSRICMVDSFQDETEYIRVRNFASGDWAPVKHTQEDRIELMTESMKVAGSFCTESIVVSNETSVETIDQFMGDDGSVFSVAVVAHENKHLAGNEDTKPRVTFSMYDVVEEGDGSPKLKTAKLPAVAYLRPNRVAKKLEPVPPKKLKPFNDIYGVKKRKRRKKDVLRKRLNAQLRKEEEIRQQREMQEEELHPPSDRPEVGKSPGAEYELESFDLGRSTHSVRVASPRTKKHAAEVSKNEEDSKTVNPEPAEDSEIVVKADVEPSTMQTPERMEDKEKTPPKQPVVEKKASFFRRLWAGGKIRGTPSNRGTHGGKKHVSRKAKGVKASWLAIAKKIDKRKKPSPTAPMPVNADEKAKEQFSTQKPPVKNVQFMPEFVTPTRRRKVHATPTQLIAAKAHTDPVKKPYSKIYQSRISWNAIKKRLVGAKDSKSPKTVNYKPINVSADDTCVLQPRLGSVEPASPTSPSVRAAWKPAGKIQSGGGYSVGWQNLKTRMNLMRMRKNTSPGK